MINELICKIFSHKLKLVWKSEFHGVKRFYCIRCNRYFHQGLKKYDYSQDNLLKKFEEGKKIDFKKFSGIKNNSVHQEVNFDFIERQEAKK